MKVPRSNVVPMRPNTGQPAIPPAYYAMAAAHMMKMGKQVFENQPPTTDQLTEALSGQSRQQS